MSGRLFRIDSIDKLYTLTNVGQPLAPNPLDRGEPIPAKTFATNLRELIQLAKVPNGHLKTPKSFRIGLVEHLWGLTNDVQLANRLFRWTDKGGRTMFSHYGSKFPMAMARRLSKIDGLFEYSDCCVGLQ